jgi:hypothetical protein
VIFHAARAIHGEIATGCGLHAPILVVSAESHLRHQFGPAVHVVGIVGRANHVFGEIENLVGIGLNVVGIDAAGGGVNYFFHFSVLAGVKDHAVEHQIHRTGGLMQIDVASSAVIGGQVEDHAHACRGSFRHALGAQIAFQQLDAFLLDVLADIAQTAAAHVVHYAHMRTAVKQGVDQIRSDE